jgi:hypothetical protein
MEDQCPNCKIKLICIEWPNGIGGYDVTCNRCGYYDSRYDGGTYEKTNAYRRIPDDGFSPPSS